MATFLDGVIVLVLMVACDFAMLLFACQPKAAPSPSSSSSATSSLSLPATEVLPAPESASLVGSCRLHPLIEGKLPLSPKAVEPSYEVVWVPQDPPQRPGNGLIPKALPRPRRPDGPEALAAKARYKQKHYYYPVPTIAPLKLSAGLQLPSRLNTPVKAKFTGGMQADAERLKQQQHQQQQQQRQQQQQPQQQVARESHPNQLLEMSDADALATVDGWLTELATAPSSALQLHCQRNHDTISNIAEAFKFMEQWLKIEGTWNFDKVPVDRLDVMLSNVSTAYSSLQELSKINDGTHEFVSTALRRVERMGVAIEWAKTGN